MMHLVQLHRAARQEVSWFALALTLLTAPCAWAVQLFDAGTQKQYPQLIRYLSTLYGQEAWRRALRLEMRLPAKACSLESPWFSNLDEHSAALADRIHPQFWSGARRTDRVLAQGFGSRVKL